jgi:hypothetical protein
MKLLSLILLLAFLLVTSQKNVENKPGVLYVQMGHVVAIGDIVALLEFTVTLVVRASVGLEKNLHHLHSL